LRVKYLRNLLKKLKKFNISTSNIKPLFFDEEMKIYRRMVEEKRKRILFTTQKPLRYTL